MKRRSSRTSRWRERLASPRFRAVGATVAVALGALILLAVVRQHYPIGKWLLWTYAKLWLIVLYFAGACLSGGFRLAQWLVPRACPLRERLVLAVALGVLLFALAIQCAGLLGLVGGLLAVALPATLVLLGAQPLLRTLSRAWRHLQPWRQRPRLPRPWWTWPVAAFGTLGVLLVYLNILTPENLHYDARWYHLGIAQQYVAEGAIQPSPEGWFPIALPQLASLLYTWAFCWPGLSPFERIGLAAHVELVVFLWTLASIPVLVRWLVPRSRAGLSWAAVFLFPGILLYDSSLSTAADHIAAFWAVPIFLALRRAWRDLHWRSCLLLAAMLAGALLTKYQSVSLAAFPIAAVAVRAGWLAVRDWRSRGAREPGAARWRWLLGPGVALLGGLLLTAPHWLKNWLWYGDPLFPYLHELFPIRPWNPDVEHIFEGLLAQANMVWRPTGPVGEQLRQALEALVTFSFVPNDWPDMHGSVPVFGFLFTLSLLWLPFVRRARRIWLLVASAHLGVFVWYLTFHQDRYLQLLLPWMAAATAAAIIAAWRMHRAVRVALVGLIGLQVVWGGDVYFIPTHSMAQTAPIKRVADLLAQGFHKNYQQRFEPEDDLFHVGKLLPANARVLLHDQHLRLGLFRPVVSDIRSAQSAISYARASSPRAVHELFGRFGITHIVWGRNHSTQYDSIAGDLRFFEYVAHWAERPKRVGRYFVARVVAAPPELRFSETVAYLGCGPSYERGLYALADMVAQNELVPMPRQKLRARRPAPSSPQDLAELPAQADFVVRDPRCQPMLDEEALEEFFLVAIRGHEELWIRKVVRL